MKRRYLVTSLIGLALALAVAALKGAFTAEKQTEVMAAFCDGCFVSGILLAGVGALLLVANDGFFDFINYGVQKAFRLMLSQKRQDAFPRTFYEYREIKNGTRKGSLSYILLVGLAWIALAAVFLAFSMPAA